MPDGLRMRTVLAAWLTVAAATAAVVSGVSVPHEDRTPWFCEHGRAEVLGMTEECP